MKLLRTQNACDSLITHTAFPRFWRLLTPGVAAVSMFSLSATAQDEADSDVFELSPFVVDASDNQGWNPTQTLAGSRLRTNLGDVASQIEVITMDFMDDFGFSSIEEAAIYTMNAENEEEWVGSGAGKVGTEGNLRFRGLSTGNKSRDFFVTGTRSDNYNLDRVTLASGPNPMMFGIGAPGGSVNASLARALINQNTARVKFQIDSWGSMRGEFHVNQSLIKDKLALRVSLLADNKKYDVEPSLEQTRRAYATLTWTPWEKTRISAHYERVEIESRRPARNTPYELYTGWVYAGDLGSAVYGNSELFENTPQWAADERPLVSGDPVFNTSGDSIVVIAGDNPANVPNLGEFGSVRVQRIDDSDWGLIDQVNKDIDGTTVLDDSVYPRDVNSMYHLDWREPESTIYNLFLNQEIMKNLHFEAALQREEEDSFVGNLMGFRDSVSVHIDPNKYLTNGELNPYAGMLFFDGGPEANMGFQERTEWRTSLSYEFDIRDHSENKFLRWLGRHRLAGMLSGLKEKGMNQEYRYHILPKVENGMMRDPYFVGYDYDEPDEHGRLAIGGGLGSSYSAADGNRYLSMRSYVGFDGNMIPTTNYTPGEPFNIVDSNGETWIVDPMNADVGTNGERLIVGRNIGGQNEKFDTKMLSYQGFFFNDRIIVTYGWREDSAIAADEMAPDVQWQNPETGEVVDAGSVGYQAHYSLYGYEEFNPDNEQTGETELKGIVVHPFRNWGWELPLGADISFSYNEANTFQPSLNSLDPDGRFQDGELGDGTDKGVRLSLFHGKFNVKYVEYEVIAGPTSLNLPFRRFRFALRPTMRDILQGLVANEAEFREKFPVWPLEDHSNAVASKIYPFESGGGFDVMNFFNFGDPYGMTADTTAEGKEIILTWQPTNNWDIRFTWNEQTATQTNIAPLWIEFATEIEQILDNTYFTEGYVPGDSQSQYHDPNGFDTNGDGIISQYTWTDIPDGGGNGRTNPSNVGNPNYPWGGHDEAVEGGWTRNTMKEQFLAGVYQGNAGIPVMQAYEGRNNEFVRQNRWNLNLMYRFTEGRLKGLRTGIAYRWREAPALGFGVQNVNGATVPDTDIVLYGEEETAIDLSLGYRGKSSWLGDRNYSISLNVRNAFPTDSYVAKHVDFYTGDTLSQIRVNGRQFILSFEIDL